MEVVGHFRQQSMLMGDIRSSWVLIREQPGVRPWDKSRSVRSVIALHQVQEAKEILQPDIVRHD